MRWKQCWAGSFFWSLSLSLVVYCSINLLRILWFCADFWLFTFLVDCLCVRKETTGQACVLIWRVEMQNAINPNPSNWEINDFRIFREIKDRLSNPNGLCYGPEILRVGPAWGHYLGGISYCTKTAFLCKINVNNAEFRIFSTKNLIQNKSKYWKIVFVVEFVIQEAYTPCA